MKKHLLFITPSKSIGGTNSSLSSVVNSLKDEYDIKVLIMSSYGEGSYSFDNNIISSIYLDAYYTNFSFLRGKVKFLALFIKVVKRILSFVSVDSEKIINSIAIKSIEKKFSFDIVIGFSEGQAMRMASQFRVRNKLTWIHCDYDRTVPKGKSELNYYQKFNSIVCVSKYTMQKFINRYPTLESKTTYIYNLLDIERIKCLSDSPLEDSNFKSDIYTIISVGRMDPVKRFTLIPRLACELKQKGYRFRWYIIGGPSNDEFQKVQLEIINSNVADRVYLLGEKRNPYPYMKASDLYVSISKSEACPMVFNEAKILGLPILSVDFGSANEFVNNLDNSRVVPINHLSITLESFINRKQECSMKYNLYDEVSIIDLTMRKKIADLLSCL